MKVTFEDENGIHEYQSNSDCIVISDDGNGNVTFSDEEIEEEELQCNYCEEFCKELNYCIYEGE